MSTVRVWKPKIIYFEDCTLVGPETLSSGSRPIVCSGGRDALFVSQGHYRLPNGSWSGGGPFFCVKTEVKHTGKTNHRYCVLGVEKGHCPALSVTGSPQNPFIPSTIPTWANQQAILNGLYATGYARARPGNPVASVGQFIVELRDLPQAPFKRLLKQGRSVPLSQLPRILKNELLDFKNLGSEYLNIVFGWKPFVADLRKMYNLWHDIDKRMAQIIRENGKYIRRRATVSDETTTTEEPQSTALNAYQYVRGGPLFTISGPSRRTVVSTVKTKVWFSGSFRYYIPDVSSSMWDRRARLALFGALPTPELLWNVLPWSWLIDWFSNVGDVISNVGPNAVDNLTTRYSYIMKRSEETKTWTCNTAHASRSIDPSGPNRTVWDSLDAKFTSVQKTTVKSRQGGGNPFGLNVQLSSLSSGQLAILAALGLSRSSVK
jgi:hypothetical protein